MGLEFTDVKKEGQYFVFTAKERKNPIKFDCIKGCFVTPRKVFPAWEVPDAFYGGWREESLDISINYLPFAFIKTLKDGFAAYRNTERKKQLISFLETIYANKDLLSEETSFRLAYADVKEFPRGFFKWLREENKEINRQNLLLFTFKDYYKNKKIACLLEDIKDKFNLDEIKDVNFQILSDLAQVHAIFRKSFHWNSENLFRNFYRTLFRYNKDKLLPNLDKWLDKNRDYEYNLKLADAYINKERNEKILANENKIREIEKLETENLCIKVPSTIEDFTAEGKMQNNCVGSYYHDNIARGDDLVYFIRKKDNKEHSYVTCRFHLGSYYSTTEYRIVNNGDVKDKEALEFIGQIDQKIKAILKEG